MVKADLLLSSQNTGDAAGDTFVDIENLTGSDYNDTLKGDNGDNILTGGLGDDYLFARDGNDTLIGGAGNDVLHGRNDDDLGLDPSRQAQRLSLALGNDELMVAQQLAKAFGQAIVCVH